HCSAFRLPRSAFRRGRRGMKEYQIAVLPGDGIGPEVTGEAVRVLQAAGERFGLEFALGQYAVGAAGVAAAGDPLPEETRAAVVKADAVLLGAVGDPSLDHAPRQLRPESGLLALRSLLGVYANLRPVTTNPALAFCSPLKPEHLAGVDILIVRELVGGLYYGEPRGKETGAAVNTLRYTEAEVERVARVAFGAARRPGAVRADPRLGAGVGRQRRGQPDRGDRLGGHAAALRARAGGAGRGCGAGDRRGARARRAHARHRPAQRPHDRHARDGR